MHVCLFARLPDLLLTMVGSFVNRAGAQAYSFLTGISAPTICGGRSPGLAGQYRRMSCLSLFLFTCMSVGRKMDVHDMTATLAFARITPLCGEQERENSAEMKG